MHSFEGVKKEFGSDRACDIRTIAVVTGTYSAGALVAVGADHVLEDFAATERVVALLTA